MKVLYFFLWLAVVAFAVFAFIGARPKDKLLFLVGLGVLAYCGLLSLFWPF